MAHQVIYVPGLGDHRPFGQATIIKCWRLFGLRAHYFPLSWADGEEFAPKLQRLLDKIDTLSRNGQKVSLVGVSAGASAVLNAYAVRPKITRVICICGKIHNPQTIHPRRFQINPAFKDSVFMVQKSLAKTNKNQRKNIMSIHPLYDQTVPIADTVIDGAVEKIVHIRGHIQSIYYTIILKPRLISNFLNNLP